MTAYQLAKKYIGKKKLTSEGKAKLESLKEVEKLERLSKTINKATLSFSSKE